MIHTKDLKIIAAVIAVGLLCSLVVLNEAKIASASAPSGLPATVYSAGTTSVGTTDVQLAATTTMCAARIVSTQGSNVMLGFSALNGSTTSAIYGIEQLASTTVAYDSGLYGCGQLSAYSFSTAVVTEVTTF